MFVLGRAVIIDKYETPCALAVTTKGVEFNGLSAAALVVAI